MDEIKESLSNGTASTSNYTHTLSLQSSAKPACQPQVDNIQPESTNSTSDTNNESTSNINSSVLTEKPQAPVVAPVEDDSADSDEDMQGSGDGNNVVPTNAQIRTFFVLSQFDIELELKTIII